MLLTMGSLRAFPHEDAMRKSITFFMLAFSLGSALAQDEPKLRDTAPDRYVVQKGDTLWGIAGKFLQNPWRWPEIWRLNQDQVANPQRIYPGNTIVLIRTQTPAQLVLEETIKLSPQVRTEPLAAEAIAAIPPGIIEPFLSQPLVIDEAGLEKAPRIVGAQENRVNLGAGGLAYVSGIGTTAELNWQIFRPGRPLVDPETNKALGYEAVYLGTARVTRAGEPATLQIVTSKQEISQGDRLVPAGPAVINQYAPHPPKGAVTGRIIALYGGLVTSEGGKNSIVSINRGKHDGLEMGHVLAILRTGATIPDPESTLSRDRAVSIRLPDERYGMVFVFRVFDHVSYALVMDSSRPVTPGDIVRTP
jgi:nucleoid-associated protein YgaU